MTMMATSAKDEEKSLPDALILYCRLTMNKE